MAEEGGPSNHAEGCDLTPTVCCRGVFVSLHVLGVLLCKLFSLLENIQNPFLSSDSPTSRDNPIAGLLDPSGQLTACYRTNFLKLPPYSQKHPD